MKGKKSSKQILIKKSRIGNMSQKSRREKPPIDGRSEMKGATVRLLRIGNEKTAKKFSLLEETLREG